MIRPGRATAAQCGGRPGPGPGAVRSPISSAKAAAAPVSGTREKTAGGRCHGGSRESGTHDVVVNTMPQTAVAKGMVHGQGGMVKVVAERVGRVLGVHLVGPHVSEMTAESRLIVGWDAEPAGVARHIHAHPTLSEAVGEAFLSLAGRGLHQRWPGAIRSAARAPTGSGRQALARGFLADRGNCGALGAVGGGPCGHGIPCDSPP